MRKRGIDYYLIPSDDFHASEYVADYFKCRTYMSGFTGSAGTLVVGLSEVGLWTDGRYFLQAEQELCGSGIELFRMGMDNVPSVRGFLKKRLFEGGKLGFDARVVSKKWVEEFVAEAGITKEQLCTEEDLVGLIWEDRPGLRSSTVMEFAETYAGKSRDEKLQEIREEMKKRGATHHLLTSLDDIAWLLNIRGADVEYTPVVRSFLLIMPEGAELFADLQAFPKEVRASLFASGIEIKEYMDAYLAVAELSKEAVLMWDEDVISYRFYEALPEGVQVIACENPTLMAKACKNPVEVENMRKAHLKDGVAMCKFLCWLDHSIGKEEISEISAASRLEEFRNQQENYRGQSFAPIIGYAEHGAIIHYSATAQSNALLKPEGFVLMDTGGQYLEGTTDITRTVSLGPVTARQKEHYTAVLKGNLAIAMAVFQKGTTGVNLDYLARRSLWERGLDYRHGTGHGVGFFLGVHEGPNAIRMRALPGKSPTPFEEGMITSDEPGVYLPGEYGIRLENLIVCMKSYESEYGEFLKHEYLTLVPFDLRAVEASMLSSEEKDFLNRYHERVRKEILPYLEKEEQEWLYKATEEL